MGLSGWISNMVLCFQVDLGEGRTSFTVPGFGTQPGGRGPV